MATAAAAALLDELMGRSRNVLPSEKPRNIRWDSPEVCRYFLVKFCPHELFTNTKSDIGPCDKVHDEELKKEFESASSYRKLVFEDDFVRYAESMLAEVDKRIRKGKQRLALSVKDALATSSTGDGRIDEQVELLSERITGLLSEAERLGLEGNIEDSQGLLKLSDQLREERDNLKRSTENSVWHQAAEMAASQEKQMEVCEVCGAFLIVGDAQQRIDDHLTGKQHVGYAKLRGAIKELQEKREKSRAEKEQSRDREREERRRPVDDERRSKDERRRRDERHRRRSHEREFDHRRHERRSSPSGRDGERRRNGERDHDRDDYHQDKRQRRENVHSRNRDRKERRV